MKKLSDLYGDAYVEAVNKVWAVLESVFPTLEKTGFNVYTIEVLANTLGITFDDDGNIIR